MIEMSMVVPMNLFQRNTRQMCDQLAKKGKPMLLTIAGRPGVVVMDAQVWERIERQLALKDARG